MREPYEFNDYYGAPGVLRRYSGYRKPINALIPHGTNFGVRIFPGEAGAPVPAVLSWPAFRDEAWARYKHVIPSCAPFLYALALYGDRDEKREGTLFVPDHATDFIDTDTDWYALAKLCDAMEGPVTVQLYITDMQRRRARFFEKRGHKVVCCGDAKDPDYMLRVIHLLRTHEVACSNNIGSNTFYAIAAGTPYYMVGEAPHYINHANTAYADCFDPVEDEKRMVAHLRDVFTPRGPITDEQRAWTYELLGASRFKTPEALLADLQACERLASAPPLPGR